MKSRSKMLSVVAAMLVITAVMVEAQPVADCATKLSPCSQSLNSTTPAKECCDSMKDAITNDLPCLCNLYNSGVLPSMRINLTDALLLPQRCGIQGDLSGCNNINGTSNTNTSSSVPPGENGAKRESWRGICSVIFLLFASSVIVF